MSYSDGIRACPRCGYWHILGEPCEGKDAERLLRQASGIVRDAEDAQNAEAWAYVRRIRNPRKKAYAVEYLRHLQGEVPEPSSESLSVMGAQAVRMNLSEIVKRAWHLKSGTRLSGCQ